MNATLGGADVIGRDVIGKPVKKRVNLHREKDHSGPYGYSL